MFGRKCVYIIYILNKLEMSEKLNQKINNFYETWAILFSSNTLASGH